MPHTCAAAQLLLGSLRAASRKRAGEARRGTWERPRYRRSWTSASHACQRPAIPPVGGIETLHLRSALLPLWGTASAAAAASASCRAEGSTVRLCRLAARAASSGSHARSSGALTLLPAPLHRRSSRCRFLSPLRLLRAAKRATMKAPARVEPAKASSGRGDRADATSAARRPMLQRTFSLASTR